MNPHDVVFVVARHGERTDYIMRDAGENWVRTAARPWDTPLSAHGHTQGTKLGEQIASELQRLELPALTQVYSSPLLRCRQTAVAAARAFREATRRSEDSTNLSPAVLSSPLVRIEYGLSESINESWYRSWSLPESDGTWGLRPKGQSSPIPETLHPASRAPVQALLDWKTTLATQNDMDPEMDTKYASRTRLDTPYTFHPPYMEARTDQRERMRKAVEELSVAGQTILLVSHGGPVTHLYEELTGNDWNVHGASSYCCYSIYRQPAGTNKWEALVINQSEYLHEKITFESHVSIDNLTKV